MNTLKRLAVWLTTRFDKKPAPTPERNSFNVSVTTTIYCKCGGPPLVLSSISKRDQCQGCGATYLVRDLVFTRTSVNDRGRMAVTVSYVAKPRVQ